MTAAELRSILEQFKRGVIDKMILESTGEPNLPIEISRPFTKKDAPRITVTLRIEFTP